MTRLSDRRRAADRCAADVRSRGIRLRDAIGAIDRRTRQYRAAIVVGVGAAAGVLGAVLPLRKTLRLASLSVNVTMVTRRLLSVVSGGDNPGSDSSSSDHHEDHDRAHMTAKQTATTPIGAQRKGFRADVR